MTRKYLALDIAIDLGTANSLVYVRGYGIVLCEPSVVAIDKTTNEVKAVGAEAKRMLGRTPGHIVAVRPMKDGVIADFEITQKMLTEFIKKAKRGRGKFFRPRVVICVPSGITGVEIRAVRDSAEKAGAREVGLIQEPMAAAIGSGLPVSDPTGSMVVDIGGGTSEVAVISLGGLVVSRSVRVAGDEMDNAIIEYIKRKYNLMIGERTAEEIKIQIGSADRLDPEKTMRIKGRDMVAGLPRDIVISSEEVREALADPVNEIINAVKACLEKCPPELAADILNFGIMLAGGGSQLRGLDTLIAAETGMQVRVCDNPETAIVLGTGKSLDMFELLKTFNTQQNGSGGPAEW